MKFCINRLHHSALALLVATSSISISGAQDFEDFDVDHFLEARQQAAAYGEQFSGRWAEATKRDVWAEFGERIGQSTAVINGHVYIFGGLGGSVFHNDIWRSKDMRNWERVVENAPWSGRMEHRMEEFNGRWWIIGGFDGNTVHDVWSSADGHEWVLENDNPPWEPRTDFTLTAHEGKMFLTGGQTHWPRVSDVWVTEDGRNWELLVEEAGWHPRSHHRVVSHNGLLVLLAGCYFDFDEYDYVYLDDVWHSTDGQTWTEVAADTGWGPRSMPTVFSYNGGLVLMSGDYDITTSRVARDIWVSVDDGRVWAPAPLGSRLWRGRVNFAAPIYDNKLWVMPGWQYGYGFVQGWRGDIWYLDLSGEAE